MNSIKNFLNPLTPYLLYIKVASIVALLISVYLFGYSNAKNKYAVKVLKQENTEVKAVLKDTNKDIVASNKEELLSIEFAQKERDEQQRLYLAQRKQTELLQKKLQNDNFKECIVDKETIDALNKSIRGDL